LVRRPLIGLFYQPRMIDDDKCGAVGGMKIGRGSRSTQRKRASVSFCPPQIPHDLTLARTRAVAVGSRLVPILTAHRDNAAATLATVLENNYNHVLRRYATRPAAHLTH
jgi:hypothetical protein